MATLSRNLKCGVPASEIAAAKAVLDFAVKGVSLLPGTYDLHTSVTDFNRQHEYDNVHLALRFDVMSGRPYESSGLVTLRPEWTITSS